MPLRLFTVFDMEEKDYMYENATEALLLMGFVDRNADLLPKRAPMIKVNR